MEGVHAGKRQLRSQQQQQERSPSPALGTDSGDNLRPCRHHGDPRAPRTEQILVFSAACPAFSLLANSPLLFSKAGTASASTLWRYSELRARVSSRAQPQQLLHRVDGAFGTTGSPLTVSAILFPIQFLPNPMNRATRLPLKTTRRPHHDYRHPPRWRRPTAAAPSSTTASRRR